MAQLPLLFASVSLFIYLFLLLGLYLFFFFSKYLDAISFFMCLAKEYTVNMAC